MSKPLSFAVKQAVMVASTVALLAVTACGKTGDASKIASDDMTMGDPNAKITLIEYASPMCPHCAEFDEKVMPELKAKYIDTGKVHYVFREFLTPPQETAAATLLLARCAGKDKYFGVLQSTWRSLPEMFGNQTDNSRSVLLNIAASAGIDEAAFDKCVTDPKGLERISKNMTKYTDEYHINGTPAFIINGKKFDYKGGGIAEFDAEFKAAAAAETKK